MNKIKHVFPSNILGTLRSLTKLNNWSGLLAVMQDYLVIGASILAAQTWGWFYPITVLIIGSRQRALASLLHEAAHLTLAKSRKLNVFLGRWLSGYLILQGYDAYLESHVKLHHRFLGDPEKDPDYINYLASGLYKIRDRYDFVLKHLIRTIFMINVPRYLKYLFINRFANISTHKLDTLGICLAQIGIFTMLFLAVGPWGYVKYWLLPYITAFQIIGWFSEMAEHFPLFGSRTSAVELTRNRFPSFWERMFIGMHGDNYHLTHHLMPSIPFWNLRRAHSIMMRDPVYAEANTSMGGIFSPGVMEFQSSGKF